MNGDSQKIYDAILKNREAIVHNGTRLTKIETQQKERHNENIKNIDKLHKTVSNVSSLKTHVHIQWWFIAVVIVGIGSIAWSSLK